MENQKIDLEVFFKVINPEMLHIDYHSISIKGINDFGNTIYDLNLSVIKRELCFYRQKHKYDTTTLYKAGFMVDWGDLELVTDWQESSVNEFVKIID